MKVCGEPGCWILTRTSRCPEHTRKRERARGTRQQRGYGKGYDAERKRLVSYMRNGVVIRCWRCDKPLHPDWFDLGHCDEDRGVIHGPECRACNRATAGRAGKPCPHISHEV